MKAKSKPNSITELVSRKALVLVVTSFVLLVSLFAVILIDSDVFERFYAYSRAHESWQLDDLMLFVLMAIFVFSIYAVTVTIYLVNRLLSVKAERILLQNKLEQSQHLVALGTILGGVSHSVNNYLTPIITLTEMVLEGMDPNSEHAADLAIVLSASKNVASIITQLKNFSRQEPEADHYSEVSTTLQEALLLVSKVLPRSLQLKVHLDPVAGLIAMSAVSFEVVLLNLINNAADAMEHRAGTIGVKLCDSDIPAEAIADGKGHGDWISLKVTDTGVGMTEAQTQRMFDPFFTGKAVGKGTGLGLSESYGIVRKAGGYFMVHSAPGTGTAIVIYLPLLINVLGVGDSRF